MLSSDSGFASKYVDVGQLFFQTLPLCKNRRLFLPRLAEGFVKLVEAVQAVHVCLFVGLEFCLGDLSCEKLSNSFCGFLGSGCKIHIKPGGGGHDLVQLFKRLAEFIFFLRRQIILAAKLLNSGDQRFDLAAVLF